MKLVLSLACAIALVCATSGAIAGGSVAQGKKKSSQCAACHGAKGISTSPQFPILAGQFEQYLLHALKAYKSGKRKNAIMNGMVAGLSEQDMEDLAAYFAAQSSPLKMLPRPGAGLNSRSAD
jgi:cytochrome c553